MDCHWFITLEIILCWTVSNTTWEWVGAPQSLQKTLTSSASALTKAASSSKSAAMNPLSPCTTAKSFTPKTCKFSTPISKPSLTRTSKKFLLKCKEFSHLQSNSARLTCTRPSSIILRTVIILAFVTQKNSQLSRSLRSRMWFWAMAVNWHGTAKTILLLLKMTPSTSTWVSSILRQWKSRFYPNEFSKANFWQSAARTQHCFTTGTTSQSPCTNFSNRPKRFGGTRKALL